jgi:hypothetical protein
MDPRGPKIMTTLYVRYDMLQGLNHVTRKWTDDIDPASNLLLAVPVCLTIPKPTFLSPNLHLPLTLPLTTSRLPCLSPRLF